MSETGTREWSESSVNCCLGCSHGCLYCYARSMALRFKRIASGEDWATERIDERAVEKTYNKRKGVVMFPTTHDITPGTYDASMTVLLKLLRSGNQVLIVSKPRPSVWSRLLLVLEPYLSQVTLRFSIGTLDEAITTFWESGAPTPWERVSVLQAAHGQGFRTSISMEPLLCPGAALTEVHLLRRYVTDTLWIGMANRLHQRCAWAATKLSRGRLQLDPMINTLEISQSEILTLYDWLRDVPKLRWKDSYRKLLATHGIEVRND